MIDVPNLDDLSVNPADYRELETTFNLLASYCSLKARSIDLRTDGNMVEATRYEKAMDRLYQKLPSWAKW
jgi:hypothetical protein